MAKKGLALKDNNPTKFYADSSEGLSLQFSKGDQEKIDKGIAHFNYLANNLKLPENDITKEDLYNKKTQRILKNFLKRVIPEIK